MWIGFVPGYVNMTHSTATTHMSHALLEFEQDASTCTLSSESGQATYGTLCLTEILCLIWSSGLLLKG